MPLLQFILNNREVRTNLPAGMVLLDFVRYHQHLTGTKIGCREGDCGACTVLVGELTGDEVKYRTYTSCLTPIGNVQGRHVVTVEGVNQEELNPVQQAMADAAATQCGFCTPGFVMSLCGFCLSDKEPTAANAIASLDGNICRCTGYKSIERAAATVAELLQAKKSAAPATTAAAPLFVPAYLDTIAERLKALAAAQPTPPNNVLLTEKPYVSGGTDKYVQQHEALANEEVGLFAVNQDLKGIRQEGHYAVIGGAVTVTEFGESVLVQSFFPGLARHLKLVSSTPIRNMATIAGNFINASPIGDFTIMFLALDAQLELTNGQQCRELPLRDLYLGYKQLNKQPEEYIRSIKFKLPEANTCFSFEKVSKRTHLDIASVNSACCFTLADGVLNEAAVTVGGVGPVPKLLVKTSTFLKGKNFTELVQAEALALAQTEISPISDARGTAVYKRLLLQQLLKVQFEALLPAE